MASNSATKVPTQQSVKAYVDGQTTDETAEGSSNLYYTAERFDDRLNAVMIAGTNLTATYDDAANTYRLDASATSGYDLSENDTDDLSEGSTNLYHTSARADARITAALIDEDNMATNSATRLPSQQSVKAYVDAQVTASDLDFQGDSGGALSIDLDSEVLDIAGGTGIDTTGSGNEVSVAIDNTVTTLTGSQTLTNKTFTSPHLNSPTVGTALSILEDGVIYFEGATANDFETILTVVDPTADRTVSLPNATDTLVGKATTDTLTNKSIDLGNNTLTGSLAEFNSALQSESFVSLTGSETLTNKTLTSPVINGTISGTGLDAYLSGGTGVTYSSGAFSIGQAVATDSDVTFDDVVVSGNLTVNGTTTTVGTTNMVVSDKLIELANGASGSPSGDLGIVMERGSSDNVFIGWDESADKFTVGTGSFTGASTGNLSITTGTIVANIEGDVTGTITGAASLNLLKTGGAMTGAITTNSTFDGRDVAADGVTADAALPKAGGAMTGAITTNSTFDGRDVATDGTKLDAIEASADVTDATNVEAAGAVMESGNTASAKIPSGTTAQRDGSPSAGFFRWNTTTTAAEIYDGSDWALVGGGNTTGKALWEHSYTVTENYEMTSGNNALTAGPITINSGSSVTVPSGSTWVIV
jgi:hypothetical protein